MEFNAFYFPLAESDLRLLETFLRSQDVFTPSFLPERAEDVYEAITYRIQESQHQTATVILADRNLVTRWVATARGADASLEGRIAAAVMAFALCANILIEPNIAFYEAATRLGGKAMNEELAAFRVADNLHPAEWASIALGTVARLDAVRLEPREHGPNIDFEMPLRRWRRNYVIALKIAELELRGGPSHERIRRPSVWGMSPGTWRSWSNCHP